MARERNEVTVIPIDTRVADVRGIKGGVAHAANDGEIRDFQQNMAEGMTEARAFEVLADSIAARVTRTQVLDA